MSLNHIVRRGGHSGVRGKVGLRALGLSVVSDCTRGVNVTVAWTCHDGAAHLRTVTFVDDCKAVMVAYGGGD